MKWGKLFLILLTVALMLGACKRGGSEPEKQPAVEGGELPSGAFSHILIVR